MVQILPFEEPIAELDKKIAELETLKGKFDINSEIEIIKRRRNQLLEELCSSLTLAERIQIARHPGRPHIDFYIEQLFSDFTELSGDRLYKEDKAIVAGIGRFEGEPVAVMGHRKGESTKDNLDCNFAMARPEGYRKTQRVMSLAEKFRLPVINFIDTPGAYPGIGAEERGQAEAIANNLFKMSSLKTPIFSIITGEGGSGGALALAVADKVAMLSYSIYGVISPEGCSSILWRSAEHAQEAAKAMKIAAEDLLKLGIIDEIIPEPLGGAHRDKLQTAKNIAVFIREFLKEKKSLKAEKIVKTRYEKLRRIGSNLL